MKKIIDFGISKSSTPERLHSGHDSLDLINGTGEFLGIICLGDHYVMITRTISSGKNKYNGQIMANEIDYDVYPDGNIVVYYNLAKISPLEKLEAHLNLREFRNILESGKNIRDALEIAGVNFSKYTGDFADKIESSFQETTRSIYPEDYDYDTYLRLGHTSKDSEIKKEKVELLIATGIPSELFELLRESRKQVRMTRFEMAAFLKELDQEKRNKK